jgi:hypothetical protein
MYGLIYKGSHIRNSRNHFFICVLSGLIVLSGTPCAMIAIALFPTLFVTSCIALLTTSRIKFFTIQIISVFMIEVSICDLESRPTIVTV